MTTLHHHDGFIVFGLTISPQSDGSVFLDADVAGEDGTDAGYSETLMIKTVFLDGLIDALTACRARREHV